MKQKILAICMVFASMFIGASLAHASQVTVSATHAVLSETTAQDGTTVVNLELIVNNTGADPLYNVSLEFASSMLSPNVPKSTVTVGNIAAGATSTSTWTVTTPMKIIFPGAPIMMNGTGIDVLGNPVSFTVFSN